MNTFLLTDYVRTHAKQMQINLFLYSMKCVPVKDYRVNRKENFCSVFFHTCTKKIIPALFFNWR
jgi:hypothetical protein